MKIMVYAVYSKIKHQNSGFKKNLTLFFIEYKKRLVSTILVVFAYCFLKPYLGYLDEF